MNNNLKIFAITFFSMITFNTFLPVASAQEAIMVKPLELINSPKAYLNKEIKISGEFDKFSTIGLDYNKALRSSKDYISFLIKRPDVSKEYTIPLSELKLIIKRDEAEKMLDIETGDRVEITGKVFSSALNDPWVDVSTLKNLDPAKKKESDEDE